MNLEIERKFLLCGDFKQEAASSSRVMQGYLSSVPERTVRVRISGERGFLTIKGIGNDGGTTRLEWEKEIPRHEAEELMELCEPGRIDKTRYLIVAGDHTYEVDEFHGENSGLIVAEIELTSESEAFEKPDWLGEEVTGQPEYFNSNLMKTPFSRW
jgi:adenylate cyclase